MKKVITLLMAALMIFSLVACNSDSNEPSTSGEPFYDMPDFSVSPTASGDTAKFSLEDVVKYVNDTNVFSFEFATFLDESTQTVYTDEALTDGEVLEESAQPLGLITYLLDSVDKSKLGSFNVDDFELYDSNKMAKMKEDKRPKEYKECIISDICLDLTEASMIIRTVYVVDEDNDASTYFCTYKVTYLGDNQYKLFVRSEDYGNVSGKEYVYITEETFNCTANDFKIVDGKYACKQETSLVYETEISVGGSDETTTALVQRSERITVDIDIKCTDGVYTVEREMIMKQSDESYDPQKATEIYRVNQHIEQKDGVYILKEHAKGTGNDGNPVDSTKYVTFTEKST